MNNNEGFNRRIKFGILLVLLSVLVYFLHWLIFRDTHHIMIYFIGDVAFVFIEVLLVTLIIHSVLAQHEKRSLLKKLNMVIGAFFSEVGNELLDYFVAFDTGTEKITKHLVVSNEWTDKHFDKVKRILQHSDYSIDIHRGDLAGLKEFIVAKRTFLLRLLENPNLLEHESFTELLWSVFHLAEELSHRQDVKNLSNTDYEHLAGDIKRVYALLVGEWLDHMRHLKQHYPYLFSLAMRLNPFDAQAKVEVV